MKVNNMEIQIIFVLKLFSAVTATILYHLQTFHILDEEALSDALTVSERVNFRIIDWNSLFVDGFIIDVLYP